MSTKAQIAIVLAGTFLASMIPGLVLQSSHADTRSSFAGTTDGGGSLTVSVRTDDYRLWVKGDGEIELAPDGSGISALSDGAYLDVTMRRGATERRVRFDGTDGAIRSQHWLGGDQQQWNADADRFLSDVMPIVLRETGLSADERVAWLLDERGHDALVDEIDLIHSDFVQRLYTVRYAESATLAATDLGRLMRIVEKDMDSDFELLTALTAVYKTQQPTGDNLAALVKAGRTIGSDFEARTLLELVAPAIPSTRDGLAAYLDAAVSIGSDFDRSRALAPLMIADVSDDVVRQAIEAAGNIGSDHELSSLLIAASERVGASRALVHAYLSVAESLGADLEHKTALLSLATNADLDATAWRILLESARDIGSDFECASLLKAIAPRLPRDGEVIAAYRATLDTIGNDFEHAQASSAWP